MFEFDLSNDIYRNFLLGIAVIYFIVVIWDIYTQLSFTKAKGKLQRGLKVWSQHLSSDKRRFLERYPEVNQTEKKFILRQDREVIISEARGWTGRDSWPYIGYINLGMPESRIQFRMPWSSFIFWVIAFVLFLMVVLPDFLSGNFTFPTVLLVALISWVVFSHYRERKRILGILNQAMMENEALE